MNHPDFDCAREYALKRLERELAPSLVYHSLAHTRDEVAPAVQRLAALEGVKGVPLLLLLTATYYHDIGFLKQRHDHELASIAIAKETLPAFGYHPLQIQTMAQIILATAAWQAPRTLLEQILVDADFDVLGTEAYAHRSLDLRRELEAFGVWSSDEAWYRGQLDFLQSHRYWTQSARRLRSAGKQCNLELVKAQLEALQARLAGEA
jgi:predicted metal-dependent HD superfamily phosphohydrolase